MKNMSKLIYKNASHTNSCDKCLHFKCFIFGIFCFCNGLFLLEFAFFSISSDATFASVEEILIPIVNYEICNDTFQKGRQDCQDQWPAAHWNFQLWILNNPKSLFLIDHKLLRGKRIIINCNSMLIEKEK